VPRLAVIGAGGLGGPIALAAAAAGADVTVCDADVVELSNLHRQIQFTGDDLGRPKAAALAARIEASGGRARAIADRFTAATAGAIAGDCDVLVDGSDDPATKFLAADWARDHRRAYVIAAALRYGGNVFAGAPDAACYRCLFEDVPDDAPTCADAGVLGPLVGWVGGVAAARALDLASGDRAYAGTIWVLDDLRTERPPRALALTRRPGCPCAAT
jgi:adenylyltransferase/sulfurtransferase